MDKEMTSSALIDLLRLIEDAGISVWLDGGWGVDALLERQTRPHKDVDIILCRSDVPNALGALLVIGQLCVRRCSASTVLRPFSTLNK